MKDKYILNGTTQLTPFLYPPKEEHNNDFRGMQRKRPNQRTSFSPDSYDSKAFNTYIITQRKENLAQIQQSKYQKKARAFYKHSKINSNVTSPSSCFKEVYQGMKPNYQRAKTKYKKRQPKYKKLSFGTHFEGVTSTQLSLMNICRKEDISNTHAYEDFSDTSGSPVQKPDKKAFSFKISPVDNIFKQKLPSKKTILKPKSFNGNPRYKKSMLRALKQRRKIGNLLQDKLVSPLNITEKTTDYRRKMSNRHVYVSCQHKDCGRNGINISIEEFIKESKRKDRREILEKKKLKPPEDRVRYSSLDFKKETRNKFFEPIVDSFKRESMSTIFVNPNLNASQRVSI
ncbi:unnamed protein product [Moneuplotes crassus]|uniref:Uncharacterized protein n=1 Tax=Euplotes crassus TaxID=5936 RepID=A0AAD1X4R7_EUPCR|nr:unnamed protein product [Moneuplotes crassus]